MPSNKSKSRRRKSSKPSSGQDSFECKETLQDMKPPPLNGSSQHVCVIECQCDRAMQLKKEKKREKRRKNKEKMRIRAREMRQKAEASLGSIIKDIYNLKATLQDSNDAIQECFEVQMSQQQLYDILNTLVRQQVESIRKEMARYLVGFHQQNLANRDEYIRQIFAFVDRIKKASPQIEKLLHLSVQYDIDYQSEDQSPFKNNLDTMTLKFLLKNDLRKSGSFTEICERIYQCQEFVKQQQLLQCMLAAADIQQQPTGDKVDHSDDSGYDSEEDEDSWENSSGGGSTERKEEGASRNKRRRERKKRLKEYDNYGDQQIQRRIEEMKIGMSRQSCNVSESWLSLMVLRQQEYLSPSRFKKHDLKCVQ